MGDIRQFWSDVGAQWRAHSDDELRAVTRAVLRHLRRELPVTETDHLFRVLPEELNTMTLDVRSWRKHPQRQPGEHTDEPEFYARVADEVGVSRDDAVVATRAIFAALKHQLPGDEVNHVHDMLPAGLKRQWELAW